MTEMDTALERLKAASGPILDQPAVLAITTALENMNERLKNLEHGHLQSAHRLAQQQDVINANAQSIGSLTQDRDNYRTRMEKVEKVPADLEKKVDDHEKRLKTVEGAVGSRTFKQSNAEIEAPKPVEPVVFEDEKPKPNPLTAPFHAAS